MVKGGTKRKRPSVQAESSEPDGGFCEHKRPKKYTCEHGRLKYTCKDCGGSAICKHGRQKWSCKDCGGVSICEHGRYKTQCKDCGGSAICKHDRLKAQCKECGGSAICEHGRSKYTCKKCGGSSLCEHGRRKAQCRDCGGSSFCEHNRRKARCKYCKDCRPPTIVNNLVSIPHTEQSSEQESQNLERPAVQAEPFQYDDFLSEPDEDSQYNGSVTQEGNRHAAVQAEPFQYDDFLSEPDEDSQYDGSVTQEGNRHAAVQAESSEPDEVSQYDNLSGYWGVNDNLSVDSNAFRDDDSMLSEFDCDDISRELNEAKIPINGDLAGPSTQSESFQPESHKLDDSISVNSSGWDRNSTFGRWAHQRSRSDSGESHDESPDEELSDFDNVELSWEKQSNEPDAVSSEISDHGGYRTPQRRTSRRRSSSQRRHSRNVISRKQHVQRTTSRRRHSQISSKHQRTSRRSRHRRSRHRRSRHRRRQ